MPVLNWIGKDKVVNHDKELPFKVLKPVKELSVGKESKNLLIEGDNLEALKALMPFYYNQVKCIYIDPPYNTGNEKWIYNDKVNSPQIKSWLNKVVGIEGEDLCRHDKWLCMMYPRLKLLYELLSDEGTLFVSIDDNELSNLHLLLEEIFGETNFVAQITVESDSRARPYGAIATTHEYVVVYAKNPEHTFNELIDSEKKFKYKDGEGGFDIYELRNRNIAFNINNRPNLYYPFWVEPKKSDTSEFHKISLDKQKGWIEIYPQESQGVKTVWRWGKDRARKNLNTLLFAKPTNNGKYQIIKKYRGKTFVFNTVWTDKEIKSDRGTLELKKIFSNKKVFDFPKPTALIKRLLTIATEKDDLILDSFAGSGTTGQAVLELNKKDGGNRKFVLVELENDIARKITQKRLKTVIKGFKGAVFEKGTGQDFQYLELNGQLYGSNGFINSNAKYEDLAGYIYFTETRNYLDLATIKNPYIGSLGSSYYFLFYEGKGKNILDENSIKKANGHKGTKIIYADKCLLDEEYLEANKVIFKQIPYELKKY